MIGPATKMEELRNYHNARKNKRHMSQRTSELMRCQAVSGADHSLCVFFFEGKGINEKEKKENRDKMIEERRNKQDNTLLILLWKKRKKKSAKIKDRL